MVLRLFMYFCAFVHECMCRMCAFLSLGFLCSRKFLRSLRSFPVWPLLFSFISPPPFIFFSFLAVIPLLSAVCVFDTCLCVEELKIQHATNLLEGFLSFFMAEWLQGLSFKALYLFSRPLFMQRRRLVFCLLGRDVADGCGRLWQDWTYFE